MEILPVVESQLQEVESFWRSIPATCAGLVHPPYTWTVRQSLQHMVDCERIFGNRLLCAARGDITLQPNFEENEYGDISLELNTPIVEQADEFRGLRIANWLLLKNLPEKAWDRAGNVNGVSTTVRALAYILVGHVRHHDTIVRQRLK
jgi:DinB superfamily